MFKFNNKLLKNIKEQGNIILKSQFLTQFTPLERYEFLQLCHRRKYKENEYIYYQNDPGTGMYFIESGRVQLIVVNNLDDSDTGNITFELEAPESFGAMSIGYELRRMSSAKCLTDCTLLGFFKPDFETLKKRHPEIALKFIEAISMLAMRQLERTTRKLEEATDTKTAFSIQFNTYYEDKG
ncbi:MAG: cyclic nucleotide-binding domain-containing protein [Balneolaceae bacterium]